MRFNDNERKLLKHKGYAQIEGFESFGRKSEDSTKDVAVLKLGEYSYQLQIWSYYSDGSDDYSRPVFENVPLDEVLEGLFDEEDSEKPSYPFRIESIDPDNVVYCQDSPQYTTLPLLEYGTAYKVLLWYPVYPNIEGVVIVCQSKDLAMRPIGSKFSPCFPPNAKVYIFKRGNHADISNIANADGIVQYNDFNIKNHI